jgi:hypothetical protein
MTEAGGRRADTQSGPSPDRIELHVTQDSAKTLARLGLPLALLNTVVSY